MEESWLLVWAPGAQSKRNFQGSVDWEHPWTCLWKELSLAEDCIPAGGQNRGWELGHSKKVSLCLYTSA